MIYGAHFNLIHVPKTGGTWMRAVSQELPKGYVRDIHPRHQPYSDLPREIAKKPTYAFVRNPWDWYVSLYSHRNANIRHKRHEFAKPYAQLDDFHRRVYDRFSGDFARSLEVPMAWEEVEDRMGEPLKWVGGRFFRMTTSPFGFQVKVLRFEDSPVEGFVKILKETTPGGLPPKVERMIRRHPKKNVSERRPYREYYTPELRDKVAQVDAAFIARFGYSF